MNELGDIQQLLVGVGAGPTSILMFLVNLVLATGMSYWIGRIYIKYGSTLSNRQAFAKNFVLLTLTTMLVISIVKSSLALSLGLIGALSIVRFRAAIKDPEELSYLFLAIAVGLGMGAGQQVITVVAVSAILMVLWLRSYLSGDRDRAHWDSDLYLTVSSSKPGILTLDVLTAAISDICKKVHLKRADISEEMSEALFLIELAGADDPHKVERALRLLDGDVNVTYLEAK